MSSLPVLQEVDVEVDGAVEGGEEVAGARDVGEPAWPAQLRRIISSLRPFPNVWNPFYRVTQNEYRHDCNGYLSESYFSLLNQASRCSILGTVEVWQPFCKYGCS